MWPGLGRAGGVSTIATGGLTVTTTSAHIIPALKSNPKAEPINSFFNIRLHSIP
jgi:hypothetical protein